MACSEFVSLAVTAESGKIRNNKTRLVVVVKDVSLPLDQNFTAQSKSEKKRRFHKAES